VQNLTAKHREMEVSNVSLQDEIKKLTAKGWVVLIFNHVFDSC